MTFLQELQRRWRDSTIAGRFVFALLVVVVLGFVSMAWAPAAWALAALASGALLGFLFAIPRVVQSDAAGQEPYRQKVNSNLEEISDWLTKIIVGIGLFELSQVPPRFESLARFLVGGTKYTPAFAGTVLVLFSAVGFLLFYLLTRLYLSRAFSEADRAANDFNRQVAEALAPAARESIGGLESMATGAGDWLEASPKQAVLDAWDRLQNAAQLAIARRAPSQSVPSGELQLAQKLVELQLADQTQARTFLQLFKLRNTAAQAIAAGLSQAAVREYVQNAAALAAHLETASRSTNAGSTSGT